MLNKNILYIIPLVIKTKGVITEDILSNGYISKEGLNTYLYIRLTTSSAKYRHWIYFSLSKEKNFYGFIDGFYKFMIPVNIALCADTVYKSGVGMLPNNRIEECFDFWRK